MRIQDKLYEGLPVLDEYSEFVNKGVSLDPDNATQRLNLGAMGLAGEGGEVVDHIKKHVFHGKEIDMDYLLLELGDTLWYYTLILRTLNLSLEDVIAANVKKLEARYPDRHSDTGVEQPVVKAPRDFEFGDGC
jgi:NTP pyrophosphatase (non-canonical NTP hydrolase)